MNFQRPLSSHWRATLPRNKHIPTLVGDIYDRWEVIAFSHIDKGGNDFWFCRCSCPDRIGKIVRGIELRKGKSRSCGCYARSLITVHGMHGTPAYPVWKSMRQRC